MDLNDTMHDGDVPVFNLENEYLSGLDRVLTVVCQEKQVTSIECWLHTTTVHTHTHKDRQYLYKVYACDNVVANHRQSKQKTTYIQDKFFPCIVYIQYAQKCPPRCACAARVQYLVCVYVCVCVCVCVLLSISSYSHTTGYEATHEQYQRLHNCANQKKMAMILKRLRSRDITSEKANMHNHTSLPRPIRLLFVPCGGTRSHHEGPPTSACYLTV